MNLNVRLCAAVGLALLLGTAAYSQMGGGDPSATAPGAEVSGIRETPPGFEMPPAEEGGPDVARKNNKWNITETISEWEKIGEEGPEGSWSQARDIFRPGKGVMSAPAADRARAQVQARADGEATDESVRMPVLHGVMTGSDGDRVAILGQSMVREGDFCEGFTVRSIKPRRVTLSRDGKEYVLYVKE